MSPASDVARNTHIGQTDGLIDEWLALHNRDDEHMVVTGKEKYSETDHLYYQPKV